MKNEELVNATIKALTEGVVRKRTKKVEEKETNLISSYDFKNDKTNPIWIVGTVTSNGKTYKVNAKVFLEGSEFGIDNGPISKLWIQGTDEKDYKPVVNYDRGWDIEPSEENKALYNEIMKLLVDFRNANPYEVDETQEPKTESTQRDFKSEFFALPKEEQEKYKNCVPPLKRTLSKVELETIAKEKNLDKGILWWATTIGCLNNFEESKKIEETVRFTAYGKTYYEMSEEEYDNKSDEEIQNIIIDTADQATEEEGHTVETDEVEILFENKALVEKRNKYKLGESKLQEEWFGVKDATYQYNGDWSDPMVKYRGYLYDYYDISDYVYNCMIDDYKEEGKELPPENSKEYDDIFNKYMYDEVENALIDLWPYKIDPDVIDYIEDGVVAGNAAEFIKKASNVDTSFAGVISRLESLKENTDIPEKKIDEAIKVLKDDNVDKSDIVDADDRLDELMPIVVEIISKVDDFGDYMYESKKVESKDTLKLSDSDIEYLKKIGETDEDIPQIERALNVTKYTLGNVEEDENGKTIVIPDEDNDVEITADEAREILGDEIFLSGLSRSAFHWNSGRWNNDNTKYVSFDSSKLFEESKEIKTESKDVIDVEEDISKTFNPSFDAFVNNFGKIYIIKDKYDKLYKVYKEDKLGIDDYIYYADNKEQILGLLDGAIKANNGVFNK